MILLDPRDFLETLLSQLMMVSRNQPFFLPTHVRFFRLILTRLEKLLKCPTDLLKF